MPLLSCGTLEVVVLLLGKHVDTYGVFRYFSSFQENLKTD